MKTSYSDTQNPGDIYSTDCFETDMLHSHVQHSEAMADQLMRLESLNVRASMIVQNMDNQDRGLQAMLLAPGIYASADMPPLAND